MANTYLTAPFKDKDAAKGLGARWDAAQRQWFVPEGRELTHFALWLPAGSSLALNSGNALSILDKPATLAIPAKKVVSLFSLLGDVSRAVAQAYKGGVTGNGKNRTVSR